MGKILIIRGGALGDFILTLPAIQLIKNSLPKAKIEILGYPNVTPVAEFSGLADATRSMEYGPLSFFFAPGSKLPQELVDYFSEFDVVISYLFDPDGYFEANMRRAGVETYFSGPYKIDESGPPFRPAAAQLADPLEQLALFLETPAFEITDPEPPVIPDSAGERVIAIHPGSGSPLKNWSYEGWIEVAALILKEHPKSQFLFISGEAEDQTIEQFLELANNANLPFRHLAHPTLRELSAELTAADLFLGHDTGVSHLAGASGVRSILLFGKTNPLIWAPQNENVSVIEAPSQDLSKISPKRVWREVCEVFHTLSTE